MIALVTSIAITDSGPSHPAEGPPFTGISPRQVSAHAAVQCARRLRQDPRALAWSPRSPVPSIPDGKVPVEIRAAVDEARDYLVQIARHGTFTTVAPAWLRSDPDRDRRYDAYLVIGDDVALLLVRGRPAKPSRDHWLVTTVVTRNGLDSPYSRERKHARRARVQARERRPERWFSVRAYRRPHGERQRLRAEYRDRGG
ncbi:hypothetical protein [Patulibacter medicamentivorans]|uniref:hypothetical protein n=1 Tax=Patulibacter medicamentivorans TaxID=1097667 RepID=UPI00059038C1|nr:hypothetical protein [Patulibacter medicamentivorans]